MYLCSAKVLSKIRRNDMGKILNIGKADFEQVRRFEYVDKSMLVAYVNGVLDSQNRYMCVSRARRFGKSLAAKMLCAYYDESVDSYALFDDLKIAKDPSYEQFINKYPVLYLDVASYMTRRSLRGKNIVDAINDELMEEMALLYPGLDFSRDNDLIDRLYTIVQATNKRIIMIIDEWDAICRDEENSTLMDEYVVWLRNLFKHYLSDQVFAGVYMTGILPIKQYNTESALNNFVEFSMINPGRLAGYFGFTKEEVRGLCKKYKQPVEEIKRWYDGYQMGDVQEVYNPFAVMRALAQRKITGYWTSTTTYESLKRYISMNYEGLRDSVVELLAGNEVRVDVGRFANDVHALNSRDAVLTLLIHLGYLSYDEDKRMARIPNYEVQQEFERTIQDGGWEYVAKTLSDSEQLLADTLAGKEGAVASAIDYAHQDNTSILQYNDENSLACVLSLAYVAARKDYVIVRELPAGKGFADIVLVPRRNVDKPAVVLELKYDKSAEGAIKQIKEKRYADALREYVGEVVLVGINYDKDSKRHECVIERMGNAGKSWALLAYARGEDSQSKPLKFTKYSQSIHKVILLLKALEKPLTATQMRAICEKKDVSYFNRMTIQPMMADGVIVPTDVDSMRSPKQKYLLTEKGLALLEELSKK